MDNYQKIQNLAKVMQLSYQDLPYHNFNHALDVLGSVRVHATMEMVGEEEYFLLESAALLHDVIYIPGKNDNEEKSAEFARTYLPELSYPNQQIETVEGLILATKWPTSPKNILEMIICDSDLDNFGRDDFFDISRKLLQEWGSSNRDAFYQRQLDLLNANHYYTNSAKKLREQGKQRNIEKLKKLILEAKC